MLQLFLSVKKLGNCNKHGSEQFAYYDSQRHNIDMLVQERRNSIANAPELRLSCTDQSICRRELIDRVL